MSDPGPQRIPVRRGFSVSYKGKTLLSMIDPVAQGERLVQGLSKIERTLYLCPSPLYGYGLETLLGAMGPGSAALCVEADEQLLDLSLQAMRELLEKNSSTLRLIRSGDPALICGYIQKVWGRRRFRRLEVIRLSGGWRLFPGFYESLAETIRQDFATDWGNAMTLMKLGRRYILNAVRNLALISQAQSIGSLDFGDLPVLVLGAGPSLDMVLERLPASPNTTERPFRIICADTCLQALEEWNVTPDLVVALESQHWNLRDFVGLGSWKIPVAIDLSALPATRDVLGGECLLFATPWTELRFFRRLKEAGLLPELIPPLGSVGLTTVAVARRLSTGPIVTSGLDFSYTLDSFHARSTPSHREKLYRQTRFKSILNGDAAFQAGTYKAVSKLGGSVRTNPSLKTYRDLFEREFAEDSRIKDIIGPGLPLGVETIGLEGALKILQEGGAKGRPPQTDIVPGPGFEAVKAFIHQEQAMLRTLRNMMTGEIPGDPEKLETLLDEADYLWSHFPECAGTGGRRPSGKDLSFLKRVRLEIDPLIRNFDLALREAGCHLPRTKGFF